MARRLELSLTSVGAGREGVGGADVGDSGDVVQSTGYIYIALVV